MLQRLKHTIIETDYIFLAPPINEKLIKKYSLGKQKKNVFLLDKNIPYYIWPSEENSKGYEIFECKVIDEEVTLKQIISYINEIPFLFVRNKKNGQYLGYITKTLILEYLFTQNYEMSAYIDVILNTMEGSCIVVNKEHIVLHWTKGAEKIFSIKREEILGKPITDYFSEDRLELLNTLKGTSVYQRRHHAREDLVVLINSNPVYLNGEIIGGVVYETDITSQVRLNNQLNSTSEKLYSLEMAMRKSKDAINPFMHIKGNSEALQKSFDIVKKAAKTNASMLIYGESGVGKELFAKLVHDLREKENAPFIAINCGAIASSLFESEIFGYEKGAFSGADVKGKKGKIELANGGTLFLDEIGEMPLEMQVKFLRVLQEKCFYPVGGTKEISVDFRVVAATNRDLHELMMEGKFREDLYYRLNVVHMIIPPLRERREDIIELTHYFLYEYSLKYNRPIYGISEEVMNALVNYNWPGNIRELKNTIERLVVFSENNEIKMEDLPFQLPRKVHISRPNQTLSQRLEEVEKEIILQELSRVSSNKIECANNLGISRATLYNRMNKLNIRT